MKRKEFLLLIGVLIALPIGYYLLSPLFFDRTVDEAFPAAGTPQDVFADPAMPMLATQMMADAMTAEPSQVQEQMPENASEMEILFQGSFYDLAHHGTGIATVYRLSDGSRVLRFEDFEVLNGPDLHVYLAVQDPVPNTVGLELEGAIDLGSLKGNLGNQNYLLPSDLPLESFKSVVIWCQPFRVPFNAAPLAPVP